jgi:succinate dehydrogenase / fumarate reductase, cytochrome b subunit
MTPSTSAPERALRASAPPPGPLGLLDSTIGLKAAMALSGAILFGFTIAHFLGNALIFVGPEAINAYSRTLHEAGALLWVARAVLVGAVALHIGTALRLTVKNAAARPQPYRVKRDIATSYAARTMVWSGPILLGFIVYHLAHLTFGVTPGPYEHSHADVYANLVNGFSVPWVAGLYIVSMVAFGYHLFHGAWSMFQTLGINHSAYNARIKSLSVALALFVTLGNISIPLAVLLGLVHP